jgi:beta-galactosidase/beta-glucuronidase
MRGRDIGIWGDVSLSVTEAVTIENSFVSSKLPLPDISSADLTVQADLINHHDHPFDGTLQFQMGDIKIQQRIQIAAGERKTVSLDPTTTPALHLKDPKLWWPAGYGDPHLYDAQISIEAAGKQIDKKTFKAGIRHMTYSEDGGALRIWINGRRFIARGGNWGFGESMLRYRAREYDAAVRYHREMNFTMIRNWVGQIGDEAFYEACDRYGIVVWQDFWLANPWDGPEPDDNELFLSNVKDVVLRIRNHPSVGLYCGRNEGFPPPPLEQGIRKILGDLHPGLHYIPSSADEVVSGHGPYWANPASFYFDVADKKLHSEIGAPNIPSLDSVRLMMPEKALWPQALDWGLHDFCLQGAMGGAGFRTIVENSYGGATNAEEWIRLAQFINYDTYRAMFEAQSHYRMGVLLWMSHSCWPSFVWQTYDYFFEPTAAYYGCKKGSEPLHIQWNCAAETIEVVNYSAGKASGLTANVEILNMDGKQVDVKTASLESTEDSTTTCINMKYPAGLSPVHFLRLSLKRGTETLSSNFYMRGLQKNDFRAIRQLPKPTLAIATTVEQKADRWVLSTNLHNTGASPALMVRVKAVRQKTGDRILPAIYSDNYIALMPGESRTIVTEVNEADTRGEKPAIVLG